MNDYFKPVFYRWDKPITLRRNIRYTFMWLKWCCQRAFRGWADCDLWDMDWYLITIILPMLKELRKNSHGYPGYGEASTSEKWDAILDKMIEGFEAGCRITEDAYYMKTNSDILTRQPTSEEVKGWIDMSKTDQVIFNNRMKLFSKWFFHLWD